MESTEEQIKRIRNEKEFIKNQEIEKQNNILKEKQNLFNKNEQLKIQKITEVFDFLNEDLPKIELSGHNIEIEINNNIISYVVTNFAKLQNRIPVIKIRYITKYEMIGPIESSSEDIKELKENLIKSFSEMNQEYFSKISNNACERKILNYEF